MKTFVEAVKEFEEASPWLEPKHTPALVMIYAMATELDAQVLNGELQSALLGQYGLAYRNLSKLAPKKTEEKDALEKLLEEMQQ